jgi:phenylalanine ammonia-lyase
MAITITGNNRHLRTNDRTALQRVILQNLTSGVLPTIAAGPLDAAVNTAVVFDRSIDPSTLLLPESWVKGALALRINSLMRGHSGVCWTLIEKLHALLENDIIPSPPLRQSISASGDLAPLGYIAASITDDVAVPVWSGKGYVKSR